MSLELETPRQKQVYADARPFTESSVSHFPPEQQKRYKRGIVLQQNLERRHHMF